MDRLEQLRKIVEHAAVDMAFVTEDDKSTLLEIASVFEEVAKAARALAEEKKATP